MKITWVEAFKDWLSLTGCFIILSVPIILYGYFSVRHENSSSTLQSIATTKEILANFEITLDHLNGTLINLYSNFDVCDEKFKNQMHQMSFDIPGIEAYAILNKDISLNCSNWFDSTNLDSLFGPSHMGLNITGEEYIDDVKKTGVYFYRITPSNNRVVALMSSAYLRQLVAINSSTNDTLVLYNIDRKEHMARSGLLSQENKYSINQFFLYRNVSNMENEENMHIQVSQQHPSIAAVYFSNPKSTLKILYNKRPEIALVFLLSLMAAIGWIWFRYQMVNSIEFQIKQGLLRKEFEPYLQPIVDMRSGTWIGAETLTRWRRNGQHVSYPDEFIPVSETAGYVQEITYQVTDKLYHYVNQLNINGEDFYFSINLSPNFIDEQTEKTTLSLEKTYPNISSKLIRFEITEHGIAKSNQDKFKTIVSRMRAHGYKFGLDDFGTGQSGMEYFSNITPDFLKIDRRFVNSISEKDSVDFQLLKTIVQLAQSLNLTIIAEGVETEQEKDWLISKGIYYGQGWLYQKAVSLIDFKELFQQEQSNDSQIAPRF